MVSGFYLRALTFGAVGRETGVKERGLPGLINSTEFIRLEFGKNDHGREWIPLLGANTKCTKIVNHPKETPLGSI